MGQHFVRAARVVFTALVVALPFPLQADAQAAPSGRVLGRILDAETGRPLPGAQVSVQGTRIGSLAGVDGRYIIVNVPAGEQTLVVNYIGYAPKTVTGVQVPAGAAVSLDVTLNSSAVAIAEVTVTAERERGTVSRALDAQRSATGVTSSITSEQIARSPDSDAAAAIQRVSGVTVQDGKYVFVRGLGERYTTTSLNGSRMPSPEPERKMVPLDLFPTGLLSTITTSKTFTPDLPGDFSGAQVDIRTREYPTRRQLSVSASTTYNPDIVGQSLPLAPSYGRDWLAFGAGLRQMPAVLDGNPVPTPGPQANEAINAFRNAWSVEPQSGQPSGSFGLSLGGSDPVFGRTVGYLASATYSAGHEASMDHRRANAAGRDIEYDRYEGSVGRSSVLWGGLLNLSTMFGTHTRVSLNNTLNRSADNEARIERGLYENHGTNIQIERLRYTERAVRSNQFVAEHQLNPNHRLDWSVTNSAVSRREPDRSEFVTWMDPAVPIWYNDEGAFRAFGDLEESNYEGALNYQLGFGSPARRHTLRFGGMARFTERGVLERGFSIFSPFWSESDPRWRQSPEQFFHEGTNGSEALFGIRVYNAGGSYDAEDRVLAGYSMVDFALSSRLRLVGGARIERSELTLGYEDYRGNRGTSEPAYTDVLPALALNVDLTDQQKLRFSASQTLARPEYREIAPICYRAGLGEEQRCGNPDLVRTLIQNFDTRWEWYPSPTEALSFGLFAKRFQNPIEPRYIGTSGTDYLSFQNAESGTSYGAELEAMRGLGFLGAAMAPISAFANATLMHSNVTTGIEGDGNRAMVGQAPYVFNTGLTYAAARGLNGTLLFNVVGPRIINARPSGRSVDDAIEQPRPSLDLALRFPLLGVMDAKLDLKNLLDSPYELRQGEVTRLFYRSGRSVGVGVSWRQ